jgi:hypothetical protein
MRIWACRAFYSNSPNRVKWFQVQAASEKSGGQLLEEAKVKKENIPAHILRQIAKEIENV